MAVFAGKSTAAFSVIQISPTEAGATAKAYERTATGNPEVFDIVEIPLPFTGALREGPGKPSFVNGNVFAAKQDDRTMGYPEWFENFHVIPRFFAFGNVLSEQTSPLEVFSGYRDTVQTWSAFINNAGAGTTLSGIPALPATLDPLSGYEMTLVISTNGNPSVDDDLAFVFNFGGDTINVPITLNRIVLFPVRPEIPYTEQLEFLTDILPHDDGTEQRIAVRKNPRQFFNWTIRMDDGLFEKQRMDTLLFDWQSRTWGVPMWHEATELTVSAPFGALTLNVGSTDDADYRIGGLVMVYTSAGSFDVQTIASFTSTTITMENALVNTFDIGATVAPLRTGNMRSTVQASRFISADQELQVSFRILDNDANLADTTGFSTYNGKVMLDSCNVMRGGSLSESFIREITVIDNQTGVTVQDSKWANGKRGYPLTLRANNRAEVFALRKLLHAFRGRQISFYVPTFGRDLVPTETLLSGGQDIVMENIGYTQFIRNRQARNHIWVRLKDGTILTREITGSTEQTTTQETLALNTTWGQDITPEEIDRISYLEEVRYNADRISITYARGERQVYVEGPVITTLE